MHVVDVLWNECINDLSRCFTVVIELDVNISLIGAGMVEGSQEKL